MFIDMKDTTNQRQLMSGSINWAEDRISHMHWNVMQDIIDDATGLQSLANRIAQFTSTTQADADLLIEFYQDIQDNH